MSSKGNRAALPILEGFCASADWYRYGKAVP